ncbi:MAG TPA: hypothetical protein VE782_07745, partial [Myxococcaceae bacterium]|nr:hypothetical protein [Myxococcaceae bacterium]
MRVASITPAARFAVSLPTAWLLVWAALFDACALWLFAWTPHLEMAVPALLLHSTALLPLVLCRALTESRQLLTLTLCATLPGVGVVAAAVMLRAGGRGEADLLRPRVEKPEAPPIPPPSWKRSLAARLGSKDRSERTAALGELVHRGDAPALRTLWAFLARAEGEAALEAALAIEEVRTRAEHRLSVARATYRTAPSQASAAELLDAIVVIVEMELAEGELLRQRLAEAAAVVESGWVDQLPARCRLAWTGRR